MKIKRFYYIPVCRRLFKISGGIPTNQFAIPANPPANIVVGKLSFPPSGVNCSFRYSYVKKYIPLAGISERNIEHKLVIARVFLLQRLKMARKHYAQLIIASRERVGWQIESILFDRKHQGTDNIVNEIQFPSNQRAVNGF